MIRLLASIGAVLAAAPLAAQDHSVHGMPAQEQEVDHCAMGHLPPEQCLPQDEQPAHDHSEMDHAKHGDPKPSGDHAGMDHSAHAMSMDKSVKGAAAESAVPARALEGPMHAADAIWGPYEMGRAREAMHSSHGDGTFGQVMFERLEARLGEGEDGYLWDARVFYGGDINKLVIKSEGEGAFSESIEDAEVQVLYSRAITPFLDLQAGVRMDIEPETRSHFVLGLEGLAPYMFHVDGALFLSDRGDLTARIEAEYDQKLTQQLILQPRIEIEASAQDMPERAIGSGFTKIEPGLRLRYEFVPEFAPYIGVEYEAKLGETADLARAGGEDPDGFKLVIGLRAWF